MKEEYIVPTMTVFAVSPVKALMTSSNEIPNYDYDPITLS